MPQGRISSNIYFQFFNHTSSMIHSRSHNLLPATLRNYQRYFKHFYGFLMYLTFFHTHSNILIGLLQLIFFSLTLYCRSKTRLAKSVEWLGWAVRYSFPGREKKFFCSPKTQIVSETEPASYPMRTGFLSLGKKRPWRETDCSLSSSSTRLGIIIGVVLLSSLMPVLWRRAEGQVQFTLMAEYQDPEPCEERSCVYRAYITR